MLFPPSLGAPIASVTIAEKVVGEMVRSATSELGVVLCGIHLDDGGTRISAYARCLDEATGELIETDVRITREQLIQILEKHGFTPIKE